MVSLQSLGEDLAVFVLDDGSKGGATSDRGKHPFVGFCPPLHRHILSNSLDLLTLSPSPAIRMILLPIMAGGHVPPTGVPRAGAVRGLSHAGPATAVAASIAATRAAAAADDDDASATATIRGLSRAGPTAAVAASVTTAGGLLSTAPVAAAGSGSGGAAGEYVA
jgi:hypothetical protein